MKPNIVFSLITLTLCSDRSAEEAEQIGGTKQIVGEREDIYIFCIGTQHLIKLFYRQNIHIINYEF